MKLVVLNIKSVPSDCLSFIKEKRMTPVVCFAKMGEHVLESVCQQQVDIRNNDCQTQKMASEICRREVHEYIIRKEFICYLYRSVFLSKSSRKLRSSLFSSPVLRIDNQRVAFTVNIHHCETL